MSTDNSFRPSRRQLLGGAAALVGAAGLPAHAQTENTTEIEQPASRVRNNISSFRMLDWRPYFDNTKNGAVLVDTQSRVLHFWSEDQSIYKLYPTSVPLTDELTRRGRTEIIKKVVGPEWRPTP